MLNMIGDFTKAAGNFLANTAVLFSIGNLPVYYDLFHVQDILSASSLGLTSAGISAGLVLASRLRGDNAPPHLILGATNLVSSAMAFTALSATGGPLLAWGIATAFGFWGTANILHGLKLAKLYKGKHKIDEASTHWGIADISATEFFTSASSFGWMALGKTLLFEKNEHFTKPVETVTDFIKKHAASERLLMAGYGFATATYLTSKPLVAAGFALFTAGYYFYKRNDNDNNPVTLNKDFMPDYKKVFLNSSPTP